MSIGFDRSPDAKFVIYSHNENNYLVCSTNRKSRVIHFVEDLKTGKKVYNDHSENFETADDAVISLIESL